MTFADLVDVLARLRGAGFECIGAGSKGIAICRCGGLKVVIRVADGKAALISSLDGYLKRVRFTIATAIDEAAEAVEKLRLCRAVLDGLRDVAVPAKVEGSAVLANYVGDPRLWLSIDLSTGAVEVVARSCVLARYAEEASRVLRGSVARCAGDLCIVEVRRRIGDLADLGWLRSVGSVLAEASRAVEGVSEASWREMGSARLGDLVVDAYMDVVASEEVSLRAPWLAELLGWTRDGDAFAAALAELGLLRVDRDGYVWVCGLREDELDTRAHGIAAKDAAVAAGARLPSMRRLVIEGALRRGSLLRMALWSKSDVYANEIARRIATEGSPDAIAGFKDAVARKPSILMYLDRSAVKALLGSALDAEGLAAALVNVYMDLDPRLRCESDRCREIIVEPFAVTFLGEIAFAARAPGVSKVLVPVLARNAEEAADKVLRNADVVAAYVSASARLARAVSLFGIMNAPQNIVVRGRSVLIPVGGESPRVGHLAICWTGNTCKVLDATDPETVEKLVAMSKIDSVREDNLAW